LIGNDYVVLDGLKPGDKIIVTNVQIWPTACPWCRSHKTSTGNQQLAKLKAGTETP